MPRQLTTSDMARVRQRLHQRAWAFDDPASYRAGVEEALQGLVESAQDVEPTPTPEENWRRPA